MKGYIPGTVSTAESAGMQSYTPAWVAGGRRGPIARSICAISAEHLEESESIGFEGKILPAELAGRPTIWWALLLLFSQQQWWCAGNACVALEKVDTGQAPIGEANNSVP